MEVHAHSHTPRKKWTHYLWEFIMLFLAVFCGFLAENQREHYVENNTGKGLRQESAIMICGRIPENSVVGIHQTKFINVFNRQCRFNGIGH